MICSYNQVLFEVEKFIKNVKKITKHLKMSKSLKKSLKNLYTSGQEQPNVRRASRQLLPSRGRDGRGCHPQVGQASVLLRQVVLSSGQRCRGQKSLKMINLFCTMPRKYC